MTKSNFNDLKVFESLNCTEEGKSKRQYSSVTERSISKSSHNKGLASIKVSHPSIIVVIDCYKYQGQRAQKQALYSCEMKVKYASNSNMHPNPRLQGRSKMYKSNLIKYTGTQFLGESRAKGGLPKKCDLSLSSAKYQL